MRADRLLADTRAGWLVVLALVAIYVAGFFAFYPLAITNTDEGQYVRQAAALLDGSVTVRKLHPLTGEIVADRPSDYPVGTSLYIAPFLWLAGGSHGAFAAPCAALVAAVIFTACWIREERRSPLFALLVLGFLPATVLGRVPMSELPSIAMVSLGLWLFWRGLDRAWPWWLASGFVAGSSLLFRESNVLHFAPFFAGTVLRREWKCWALVVGGLAGVSLRLLSAYLVFGDPFFAKAGYQFDPGTALDRLPYYLVGLLVLLPGGLVAGTAYRGRRRPELVTSVWLFLLFYLTQTHTTSPSGFARAVVIALRYLIPLTPVLAFAMAEFLPRVWAWLCGRMPGRRAALETLAAAGVALWVAGLAVGSVGVHWALQRWTRSQAEIRDEIYRHVTDDSVLVTNWSATRKYLRRLEARFVPLDRGATTREDAARLLELHGELYLVFLNRSDTEYWRENTRANDAFVESLDLPKALEVDRPVTPTDRIEIWRVARDLRPAAS